jgi:hypothetical protein
MTEQLAARDRFRAAYENRYTWNKDFPGFTADVTYTHNDQSYSGKVRVGADLKAEVTGVEDEDAKKFIQNQMWEIAIHRVRRSFEETHAKNEFSYGSSDPDGAVEILVGGNSSGDRYKVRNNEVSLVHRHIHGVVVTINTYSSHDTGEGYLSHRYDSVYHDPKTGEQQGTIQDFEDEYSKVNGYWILTRRAIHTEENNEPVTHEFALSNVTLLQPVAV